MTAAVVCNNNFTSNTRMHFPNQFKNFGGCTGFPAKAVILMCLFVHFNAADIGFVFNDFFAIIKKQ